MWPAVSVRTCRSKRALYSRPGLRRGGHEESLRESLVRQKKRPRPCVGFQIGAARAPKRQNHRPRHYADGHLVLNPGLVQQSLTSWTAPFARQWERKVRAERVRAATMALSTGGRSHGTGRRCAWPRRRPIADSRRNRRLAAWDSLVLMVQHKVLAPRPRAHGTGGWQWKRISGRLRWDYRLSCCIK